MDRGPISNPDAHFAAVDLLDTQRVMEKLRKNKIRFSICVNPTPEKDEAECDIFWFDPSADNKKIQRLIHEAQKERAEQIA